MPAVQEKTKKAIKSAVMEISLGIILVMFIWLFHKMFSSMPMYFHEIRP